MSTAISKSPAVLGRPSDVNTYVQDHPEVDGILFSNGDDHVFDGITSENRERIQGIFNQTVVDLGRKISKTQESYTLEVTLLCGKDEVAKGIWTIAMRR